MARHHDRVHGRHRRTPGEVGGHRYVVFANDWRAQPFEEWLDAVTRSARSTFRPPGTGSTSPYGWRSSPGEDDRAFTTFTRDELKAAIDALAADPRTARWHDAVVATYLSGSPARRRPPPAG